LCPNANEYIINKLPNVDLFFSEDCRVVLGTDSLASNDELSIWSEIKTIQKSFPEISISNLLKSATSNGAKALKIEAKYGSFEKGKQPGVILIQEDKVECLLKV
jgi:cytosine/adenosine deaminase-related metal-dependent hydrolase